MQSEKDIKLATFRKLIIVSCFPVLNAFKDFFHSSGGQKYEANVVEENLGRVLVDFVQSELKTSRC